MEELFLLLSPELSGCHFRIGLASYLVRQIHPNFHENIIHIHWPERTMVGKAATRRNISSPHLMHFLFFMISAENEPFSIEKSLKKNHSKMRCDIILEVKGIINHAQRINIMEKNQNTFRAKNIFL